MRRNIKCTVEYDGTNYFGFQKQKDLPTIQGVIESTLSNFLNTEVVIDFAGRTDRGVHAFGQVINFLVETEIPPKNFKEILNNRLPPDIRIRKVENEHLRFSSRFDAKKKIYFYVVNTGKDFPDPFMGRYSMWFPYSINRERLEENIKLFIGKHNFSAFTKKEVRETMSTVREIYSTSVKRKGRFYYLFFEGKSFLRHQVRRMVGALLKIERENLDKEILIEALNSKKHPLGEEKIPPNGLFLYKVFY